MSSSTTPTRAHHAAADDDVNQEDQQPLTLDLARHTAFFLRHLRMLPQPYQSQDTQRMTLAYFALSALDMLGVLRSKLTEREMREYADWIYAQQLNKDQGGGFLPSGHSPFHPASSSPTLKSSNQPSLAMSYTALLNLAILRDDFVRLDLGALRVHLKQCQNEEGSFSPNPSSPEADLRFVYCAFVICYLLDAWEAIDVRGALGFVKRCRNYDGGYAQRPGLESHGGSTYCALASLHLWRSSASPSPSASSSAGTRGSESARSSEADAKLHLDLDLDPLKDEKDVEATRRWLALRQIGREDMGREEEIEDLRKRRGERRGGRGGVGQREVKEEEEKEEQEEEEEPYSQIGGLNGRTGKKADVCYSFWCGAGARLLPTSRHSPPSIDSAPPSSLPASRQVLYSTTCDVKWLLSSQHPRFGGISKTPDVVPDVMHAYLAVAALGMGVWEGPGEEEESKNSEEEMEGLERKQRTREEEEEEEWRKGLRGRIGRLDPALNVRSDSAVWIIRRIGERLGGKGKRE